MDFSVVERLSLDKPEEEDMEEEGGHPSTSSGQAPSTKKEKGTKEEGRRKMKIFVPFVFSFGAGG
jgi:hypothetical protein